MFIIDVILAASLTISGGDAVSVSYIYLRPETASVIGCVQDQAIISDAECDGRVLLIYRVAINKGHASRVFRLARDCCDR